MSQIKQKGFSLRIQKRLQKSKNEKLRALDSEDLSDLFTLFWDELSLCLHAGHRVIFEGWVSFFTNPVKRKCYDVQNGTPMEAGDRRNLMVTLKHRVRFRPLSNLKEQAERELTEEQYTSLREQAELETERRREQRKNRKQK